MRLKEELDSKIAAMKDATAFEYACETYPKDKIQGTFKNQQVVIHTYGEVSLSKENALEMSAKINDWFDFRKDQDSMEEIQFPIKINSTKSFDEFVDFSDGLFKIYRVSKEDGPEKDLVFTKTQLRQLLSTLKKILK